MDAPSLVDRRCAGFAAVHPFRYGRSGMYRERERLPVRRSRPAPARIDRRANKDPLAELQQAVGNRAFGQLLARAPAKGPTIKIGKLTIPVAGGNIAAWAANEVPEALDVTSQKGKHSAELERLAKSRSRIKVLTLTVAAENTSAGQHLNLGSFAIEIANARLTSYTVDGKTESWRIADFDGVHRTKITHTIGASP